MASIRVISKPLLTHKIQLTGFVEGQLQSIGQSPRVYHGMDPKEITLESLSDSRKLIKLTIGTETILIPSMLLLKAVATITEDK